MSRQHSIPLGKDEMNLAEFPIARLGSNDKRLTIEYHGQTVDKKGNIQKHSWIVTGAEKYGLPTEFAERVLVALLAITAQQKFMSRKIFFTPYRVLKILGLTDGQKNYKAIETALLQLVGTTIYTQNAFWDKEKGSRVTSKQGFHLLDDAWLKSFEQDGKTTEASAYIVWGERIWESFGAGYIKRLDTKFYYSLDRALTRRLYRFLDKRMHYQDRYQIDIFELAARLGMTPYRHASKIRQKLQPAFDELIARGYLVSAELVKVGKYRRIEFVRRREDDNNGYLVQGLLQPASDTSPETPDDVDAPETLLTPKDALYAQYETPNALQHTWENILGDFKRSNRASYDMLSSSALLRIDDGTATIAAEQRYHSWIENRMQRQLAMNLTITTGEPVREIRLIELEATPA